ncbi:probable E3 ubiquitin-protein ligase LUL3 [Chenopodium quinoa]|uniref:probable E3 ubiquitin-protein ligase LUL3 n=1 Tax=Chenopodium quinoa TaxID=63459 RepID=UPI000B78BF7F|nr:probable E3 ubiquitin-protein ligase LUL3 [Chenopodium quinoa]
MGISFSSGRRNQNHHQHHHHPPYYHPNPPPQPPPPPPYYYHPSATTTTSASAAAIADPSTLSLPHPPPPPPQQSLENNYVYVSSTPYPTTHYQYQHPPAIQSNYCYSGWSNSYNYPNQMMGRPNFPYIPANYGNGNGWHQMRYPVPPSQVPPPYVEHQSAKVVKNDVNVHKDTIKLQVDENYPDHFLVSFVFDAHYDGSITIYYFAKEDKETCTFTPAYPEAISSVKVPFQKGVGQRFCQATGTGVDLGFFDLESLGKPSEDDVFPLVIYAEVYSSSHDADNVAGESLVEDSPRVQVTQAIIEKKNEGSFQVKAIGQILWIDGVRYELRDLYGIGNSSSETFNDDEPGKECVICMTEPKTTAVMPCRHLCMCSECAKELGLQSNKCPICRQPITELIEIKINNTSCQ